MVKMKPLAGSMGAWRLGGVELGTLEHWNAGTMERWNPLPLFSPSEKYYGRNG